MIVGRRKQADKRIDSMRSIAILTSIKKAAAFKHRERSYDLYT